MEHDNLPKPPLSPVTYHEESADDADLDQAPTADEQQVRLEYLRRLSTPPKSKPKAWLIVAIILLVVALLGAGSYLYANSHKPKKVVSHAAVSTEVKPSSQPTSATSSHYISKGSDLNLSFDYPSNWSVTPPSGSNTSDQTITVNSPLTTIAGADGKSITGKVTVSLRPVSAQLTELGNGTATIAQNSVQFAYAKPTAAQYQYPYLTFIHLQVGNNTAAAFEEVLISGTKQFAKGASITEASLAVDPIITANFYSCKTNACIGNDALQLSITNNSWQNIAVLQQALAIFESLQIN